MFTLRLPPPHGVDEAHLARVRQTIARTLDTRQRLGNRAGNQAIIDEIGVLVPLTRDESYWAEALDYHLGLLYAHVGEPELAAEHFRRSGAHPTSGGNQLFSDHQQEAVALRRHQERAKERSIPSVLIASMPRSASASLSQTLAKALDAPLMRASCGRFPDFFLIPCWFDTVSSGGAVLHDHFGAIPANLKVLREAPANKVFVRIRDPRAAACSQVSLGFRAWGDADEAVYEERVLALYENAFIPWLEAWIAVAVDRTAVPQVTWLRYGASDDEIRGTAQMVLSELAREHPSLETEARRDIPIVAANFVTGGDEAWRGKLSRAGQERLWQATPDTVRELLALRR